MEKNQRMKIPVSKLKVCIQTILDCSLCIGAYFLWIDSLSFVTASYLIIVSALSFCMNYKKNNPLKLDRIQFIWAAYALAVCINVFFSSDVSRSLSFAKLLIAMIVAALFFSKADGTSKISIKLVVVLALCLSLSVIWEFMDYESFRYIAIKLFSIDLYSEISSLKGSFNRYVGFGVYSGPSACLIIYGICAALSYMKKNIFFYIVTGINLIAIMLTGSRTLLLLIVIVWVCYQLYLRSVAEKRMTASKILLYFVAIIAIGFTVYNFVLKNSSSLRLLDGSASNKSVNARFVLYGYALLLFAKNPIFGTGINTFLNFSTMNALLENTYTHNLILQSLAEQGFIGGLLLIGAIFTTFVYTLKKWKNGLRTNSMKFSILVQIVFMIYSMVGNPFYDINLRLIYFVAVMIGLRECSKNVYINEEI